uniref:Myotubularin phosphatase domain-containing protein n=1 Tax=Macrostomum lignano TaxID=282301 RepID=A0A1I8GG22_9PLAT
MYTVSHKTSISSTGKQEEHGIDLYKDEMVSYALGDKTGMTVSLQLPEKVWYIDGKLVLTNMRLVFLPVSIQGNFFPQVFIKDRANYLSIYLPSIDHLVLVQSQRKKTKVRSFSCAAQNSSLPSKVDKLEINCCDFTRYKFCFNSQHRQRRSLLEGLSKSGAGSSGSGGGGGGGGGGSAGGRPMGQLQWSAAGPIADELLSNGSRIIVPLIPTSSQQQSVPAVDKAAIEYYRDGGYPRLVLCHSATVIVIRSARSKDDSISESSSSFFKQSVEFEAQLRELYPNLEIFNCDQKLEQIRIVAQARRRLLRHCVTAATSSDSISLDRLRKNDSDASFYSGLEATGWLRLVHQCLDTAAQLAQDVQQRNKTIWLVESTDRDWNCLLASLIRLMLCPESRSLAGFQQLVQLEWVSRHPFRTRLLNLGQMDEVDDSATAIDQGSVASGSASGPVPSPGGVSTGSGSGGGPLFLLFLDCVWQLTKRYPAAFEMSSVYLTLLHDTIQWPVFQENATASIDDILFGGGCGGSGDSAVPAQLGSLFDWQAYVNPGVRELFINILYRQISNPIMNRWQVCELQFWTENYSRNARFASTDKLMPNTVYTAPTVNNLQRILHSNGSNLSPPTRLACYYGNQSVSPHYGCPFSWSAGQIVDELLRNHLKEVGADFTSQLDPTHL